MRIIREDVGGAGNLGREIWLHTRVPPPEEAGMTAHILFALAIGNIRGKYNRTELVPTLLLSLCVMP